MYAIFSSLTSFTRRIFFKFMLLGLLSACVLAGCSLHGTASRPVSRSTHAPSSVVKKLLHSHSGSLPGAQPSIPSLIGSKGCGRAPFMPAGMSENETMPVDGLTRTYRLHIPRGYRSSVRYPLMINFHGHSSTAVTQERLTRFSTLADQDGFVVAYPQGTMGEDGRTGWNTGPWNYPHVNDIGFTGDLISHLESSLCINPQRVYAVGFSNGGGFTNVLACKLSGDFAAFAIVSGGMHPVQGGCNPSHPVTLLEIHGTWDHIVPYTGNPSNDDEPNIAQWVQSWAQHDSCMKTPRVFYQQHGIQGDEWIGCQGNSTVVHYRIQSGIHMWPNAYLRDGLQSHPLDATTVIWQFLKEHTLYI